MDIAEMAKQMKAEADNMEKRAQALRNAAAILTNGQGKRRGRPVGSKNRPKEKAAA